MPNGGIVSISTLRVDKESKRRNKKRRKKEGRICGSQKRRYRRAVKRQKVLAIRRGSMRFDALPLDFFFLVCRSNRFREGETVS